MFLFFLIYLQISAIVDYISNPENPESLVFLSVVSLLILLFVMFSSFSFLKRRKKRNLYGQPILEGEDENPESPKIQDLAKQYQLMTKYEEKIVSLPPIKKPLMSSCPNCKFLVTQTMKKCPNCGYPLL